MNDRNITIELTEEQILRISKGDSVTLSLKKDNVKKERWQPFGGQYCVDLSGQVQEIPGTGPRMFGLKRQTRKLAERAAQEMRAVNWIRAYRDEHYPTSEPDWNDLKRSKHSVFYDHNSKTWEFWSYFTGEIPGGVYFQELHHVKELVDKLNSGEVVVPGMDFLENENRP